MVWNSCFLGHRNEFILTNLIFGIPKIGRGHSRTLFDIEFLGCNIRSIEMSNDLYLAMTFHKSSDKLAYALIITFRLLNVIWDSRNRRCNGSFNFCI